jgi:hypothetical protein
MELFSICRVLPVRKFTKPLGHDGTLLCYGKSQPHLLTAGNICASHFHSAYHAASIPKFNASS